MTSKTFRTIALMTLVLGLVALPASARRGACRQAGAGGSLTPAEQETLLFVREEEKLAHDVYVTLHDIWQVPVLSNISEAEQRHMDAALFKLEQYGVPDPALGFGRFANPALQALYDELVERGRQSLPEALHVGAYIEEYDIADLEEAIGETTKPDLDQMYGNLQRASRNHLRAFVGQIESRGVEYEAQYLTQAQVDAILSSAHERGGPPRRHRHRGGWR